ncbi:ribosomal RNA large subunit methyltransferase K/L [Oxobacter pfennigii]|uniref:Ribosomal RNA large subunit methyltransferase K/L n=1 Tax=Oxobacter pfennigii TaxID=36849 RepID=A0A0P8Y8J3_9CLOT|nr:class I SAM-dependent RNA methyltransferase [Oxobacter pfennigii]KPU43051.1 ribosomal RNA large subunit methyltransferase K/L [Oxobacter pfennigii]
MKQFELIATSAFGLESVLAEEIKKLGYEDIKVENGRVEFKGDEGAIARCNLWLRTADRVLIKVGEFEALSFEELFEKTKALTWPDYIPVNANFPVAKAKSVKSKLFSLSDSQAIVKKAVVESMKKKYNREWFEETGPMYSIQVSILKDVATLTIDTSGVALHKRGYRKLNNEAPIKETLAAGMVLLSRWKSDRQLIDPMCGSATIPIEAAMIGLNMAPGSRRNFECENWPIIQSGVWKTAREEAMDLFNYESEFKILGSDIDGQVLRNARHNVDHFGLSDYIYFQKLSVSELKSSKKYGYIISNPPYGERLGEKREVEELYKTMGRVFNNLEDWSYYILTAHSDFQKLFGKKADKNRKLYNGRLLCYYYQYFGARPPKQKSPD